MRAGDVAIPLPSRGWTATRLVAATACSARGVLEFVLYVLVLGRVGCPRRGDAFCVRTRPFGDTFCVPRWSPRSPSVPGCARVQEGAVFCMKLLPGSCGARTPAGSLKRYDGPFDRVARAPTADGTAGTAPSRAVFGAPLTAALPAADAGTERVTSSAPRQHRSERTRARRRRTEPTRAQPAHRAARYQICHRAARRARWPRPWPPPASRSSARN